MLLRVVLSLLVISLVGNFGLAGAIYEGITTPHAVSALLHSSKPIRGLVACWGDSLTAGANADFGHDYPHMVGVALGRAVFNGSFGGDTSTQIKRHMLARAAGLDGGVTVIWAGRNDLEEPAVVKSNIAEMIASLPSKSRFFVLEILNGSYPDEAKGQPKYEKLMRLNLDLSIAYGDRYLPVREYLISLSNSRNPDDIQDKLHDVVPSSLRSDRIHLNNVGYSLIAAYVEQEIVKRGW